MASEKMEKASGPGPRALEVVVGELVTELVSALSHSCRELEPTTPRHRHVEEQV